MLRSLRARLTAWYVVVLAVALVMFATLLYGSLSQRLYAHHDEELTTEAAQIASLLADVESQDRMAGALERVGSGESLVLVLNASGEMLFRSAALRAGEPTLAQHEVLVHAATRGATHAQFFTAVLQSAGTVRFICVPLPNPKGLYLQVGQPIGEVDETLRFLKGASLVLIPVVLALTSIGGLVIARRALAPMDRIRTTLEAIQAEDLSRRIDVHPREVELGQLVATLNRLLDRLARAFASLREFAGDASHQLQTPLTVMKGSIDVALSVPRDSTAYREVLEEVAHQADTISSILTDLRALSLADVPVLATGAQPLPLSEIVGEAGDLLVALAEPSELAVDLSIEPGILVRGDAVRLQQVVLNLGENAVKYSRPGGRITIRLARSGPDAVLTVSDNGVGIADADLPHIFERFYRSRHGHPATTGTGLGLAIARRIVEAHGGRIVVESRPGAGTSFVVRLPVAPSGDP
ncbi:MAG: ATP-binding protein [Vicinamibacterales bacterium]